jgi:hypothetical protein
MGKQGRIEVTLFRRQTTLLYSQALNGGLDSQPSQPDETEKLFQAQPLLADEHDLTLNYDAAQHGTTIASLARQIDEVLQMGRNDQAFLGAGSSSKLSRVTLVKLLRPILGILRKPRHSRR